MLLVWREQIPASITKTKAGENRAKLILVFFFSLPSPTRPEISPSLSYRAGSLSASLIRQWPPPLLPPPASCYASTLSSSASHVRAPPVSPGLFFSLFFGGKSLSFFFLFPLAWIDRLVTFLMFPLSSRVEEADLVLHAAVESQQRLHRLQGPFILRRFSFSLFPFNLDALSLPM